MTGRRYAVLRAPRTVVYDASPTTRRYLARLLDAEANHSMPARRRWGRQVALVGRHGLPVGAVAAGLGARSTAARTDVDEVLEQVLRSWPRLAEGSRLLPTTPGPLSGILVQRTGVFLLFVFAGGPFPALVLKRPRAEAARRGLEREQEGLVRAAGLAIGPRHLGHVGGWTAQEGLPGLPLRIPAVRAGDAAALTRPAAFGALDRALERMSEATVEGGRVPAALLGALGLVETSDLAPATRRAVAGSRRVVADLDRVVLQHGDLLAQNWITHDGRFHGLIDWEECDHHGIPGADALEAAVSIFEHGLALTRWSDAAVSRAFAVAWRGSAYFADAREASRRCIAASGVAVEVAPATFIAYFAGRLGRKLRNPGASVLTSATLASMVEAVASDPVSTV